MRLPPEVAAVLEEGTLCYASANTPQGPHVTPLVFATSGGRLWLTTARRSVKARAWARDPTVSGLVRAGTRAVVLVGRARTHDLLDPDTWLPSALDAPALSVAALRFARKNARFFAGYAVDARSVPLAWTPPGRVFVGVEPSRAALLEDGTVVELWGRWPRGAGSRAAFRAPGRSPDPLRRIPGDVRRRIGRRGEGALALEGEAGTVVLPVAWADDGHALYAALPEPVLSLAACPGDLRAALVMDRTSWWRARKMVGVMAQGPAGVFVLRRLSSGSRSAATRVGLAGAEAAEAALLRVAPERLVWWRGWAAGTVGP